MRVKNFCLLSDKEKYQYFSTTGSHAKSAFSALAFTNIPDGSMQDESSCEVIIGRDVYNKKGNLVGFIGGVLHSKESAVLCQVVGVNQYVGTGRYRLDKFNVIEGRLILDMFG